MRCPFPDRKDRLLDEAHYVRYDFSTATKLLEVCQELKQRYGSMMKLMAHTKRGSELSARLQKIKHIGPVTARIFTREVAPIWYGPPKSRAAKQNLQTRKTGAQ
jgi:hypothetical protein